MLSRIHITIVCVLCCAHALTLFAAEHHGEATFAGLPVPGAIITATQADKKFVAVSDQQGVYSFSDLPEGVWTIQVDMLGFSRLRREFTVATDAGGAQWELTMLPMAAIKAEALPPTSRLAPTA